MGLFPTTLLYLGTFTISALFTKNASVYFHKYDNTGRRSYYRYALVLSLFAIIVPTLVAGFRGDFVGRDTENYVTRWF